MLFGNNLRTKQQALDAGCWPTLLHVQQKSKWSNVIYIDINFITLSHYSNICFWPTQKTLDVRDQWIHMYTVPHAKTVFLYINSWQTTKKQSQRAFYFATMNSVIRNVCINIINRHLSELEIKAPKWTGKTVHMQWFLASKRLMKEWCVFVICWCFDCIFFLHIWVFVVSKWLCRWSNWSAILIKYMTEESKMFIYIFDSSISIISIQPGYCIHCIEKRILYYMKNRLR